MPDHEKIDYVEFPAKDIGTAKRFFSEAFAWQFVDYGSEYTAFSDEGLDGRFYKSDLVSSSEVGGEIIKPIFGFPGGRRFHFTDPNGDEYAVRSDRVAE